MYCPACKTTNPADAVHCAWCGGALEDDVLDVEAVKQPRRRPRAPSDEEEYEDPMARVIPYRNVQALIAYYFGVFSLIPGLGLVLGPAALILGVLGMRHARANPRARGMGHAIAGIVLGALTSLGNWGGLILVLTYSVARR